eukprot:Platyproteum_vivax@DN10426_c0_g1_i2.p1
MEERSRLRLEEKYRAKIQKKALAAVYEREHTTTIKVKHRTFCDEEVFVVGASSELGSWDLEKAIKLQWTEKDVWKGSVVFSFIKGTEMKYLVKKNGVVQGRPSVIIRVPVSTLAINDVWSESFDKAKKKREENRRRKEGKAKLRKRKCEKRDR